MLGNLPLATFFFIAGLVLLEKGEGTLEAQIVTPLTAGGYLASKILTLTAGWVLRPRGFERLTLSAGVEPDRDCRIPRMGETPAARGIRPESTHLPARMTGMRYEKQARLLRGRMLSRLSQVLDR